MRLLGSLVFVLAVFLGVGLYLGWFHFNAGNDYGTSHITVTVDKDKLHKDESAAKDDAHRLDQDVKEEFATPAHK